ncbi:MAG TPA: M3 family oligoendopeptidase, partial [Candidatus Cloacimonadota bacterium]|nr:M3 family oligoendopeptidase [Candidatus Cloacimonadota bacterium]
MIYTSDKLQKIAWRYLPEGFDIRSWENIQAWLEELTQETPGSPDDLISFVTRYSELSKAMSDELSWRYIRMTVNADDQLLADEYNDYYAKVYAPAEPYRFRIKKIFYDSPQRQALDPGQYAHLNQIIANDIEIYRDENVPLQIQESELSNKYGSLVSKMSAEFEGEERTVAQLGVFLKDNDRSKREAAWRLRMGLFKAQEAELNQLFDELKSLRLQMAANSGFANYRDYMHSALGRFSYTPQDLYEFHNAVEKVVIPFVKKKDEHRRKALRLSELRPWDTA